MKDFSELTDGDLLVYNHTENGITYLKVINCTPIQGYIDSYTLRVEDLLTPLIESTVRILNVSKIKETDNTGLYHFCGYTTLDITSRYVKLAITDAIQITQFMLQDYVKK